MKGFALWKMLFLVITIVVTLMIIVLFLPSIGNVLDLAIKLEPTFRSMEVSSAISATLGAPDGFFYLYDGLPRKDEKSCLRIYQTYVVVGNVVADIVQRGARSGNITLLATPAGLPQPQSIAEPIVIDCKPFGTNLIFRNIGGNVRVEVQG